MVLVQYMLMGKETHSINLGSCSLFNLNIEGLKQLWV